MLVMSVEGKGVWKGGRGKEEMIVIGRKGEEVLKGGGGREEYSAVGSYHVLIVNLLSLYLFLSLLLRVNNLLCSISFQTGKSRRFLI